MLKISFQYSTIYKVSNASVWNTAIFSVYGQAIVLPGNPRLLLSKTFYASVAIGERNAPSSPLIPFINVWRTAMCFHAVDKQMRQLKRPCVYKQKMHKI